MRGTIIRLAGCVALLLFAYTFGTAQRASPAKTASGTIAGSEVTIDYSAPSVKGRKIWGGLVPYGEVWRTGANEATVFTTSKDIMVGDVLLPAGKYGLYTIPGEKVWTIIFSKKWDTWGTNYDAADNYTDKVKAEFDPKGSSKMVEQMMFEVNSDNVKLIWEYGVVTILVAAK